MSVLGTVKQLLEGSMSVAGDGRVASGGAYWCTDCGERVPEAEVAGEEAPACPGCGEAMDFERSMGTADCAC